MVRLASYDCRFARLWGRAALLCACAIVVHQPALAAVGAENPGDIGIFGALAERGRPVRANEALPAMRAVPTAAGPAGSGGTFDVAIDLSAPSATTAPPVANGAEVPPAALTLLATQAAPSRGALEQLLVTGHAPPPADAARVENGAIVLTSSALAASKPGALGADSSDLHHDPAPPPPASPDPHHDPAPPPPPDPHHDPVPDPHHPDPPPVDPHHDPVPDPHHPDPHHPDPDPHPHPHHPETPPPATDPHPHHPEPPPPAPEPPAHHPDPPPPPPPSPPPPPPATQIPRDEIVISLNNNPAPERETVEVFDLSQLNAGDAFVQVDTGVTSGADSTSWDEIAVDRDRGDTCDSDPGAEGGAAVCKDTQPANNTPAKN